VVQLIPIRRAVLTVYGCALAIILVWVPWRGYEVPKERGDPANLGYGLVWSVPDPPAAFVEYYRQSTTNTNWQVAPPIPAGYISPYAYQTAAIRLWTSRARIRRPNSLAANRVGFAEGFAPEVS